MLDDDGKVAEPDAEATGHATTILLLLLRLLRLRMRLSLLYFV